MTLYDTGQKMEYRELNIGDVVQLSPEGETWCAGCFMMVTEPRSWGAIGFVAMPKSKTGKPGQAYYRAEWHEMDYVGSAPWVLADREPQQLTTATMQANIDQHAATCRDWAAKHQAELARLMDLAFARATAADTASDEGRLMLFALIGMGQAGVSAMEVAQS